MIYPIFAGPSFDLSTFLGRFGRLRFSELALVLLVIGVTNQLHSCRNKDCGPCASLLDEHKLSFKQRFSSL